MIGAFITIYVACWVYQAAISAKKENAFKWMVMGAAIFYLVQLAWMGFDILFLGSDDIDNTNELAGRLVATYRELMPSIVGFITAAVFRTLFVLKQKLSMANLFSDMNIFKSSEKPGSEDAGSDS